MLKNTAEFFKKTKDSTMSVLEDAMGSHKAIEATGTAASVVSRPLTTLSFVYFAQAILTQLSEPDPTDHVDIDKNVLKLVHLCSIASDEIYNEKDKRKIPSELGKIIFENEKSKIGSVPFIITESEELGMIFVIIRGSYCFNDFMTDLSLNSVEYNGGLMHSGVFSAANSLFVRSEDLITRLSESKGKKPILFTGHSLGGGVAAISAYMMRTKHPSIESRAICFAPPSSVNRDIWEQIKPYTMCFLLGGDPIPFLSLNNVAQISQTALPSMVSDFVQRAIAIEVQKVVPTPMCFNWDDDPFSSPPPTVEQIEDDYKKMVLRSTALFPPGDPYHIVLSGGLFKSVDLFKIRNCDYFSRFIKGLDENHHSMSHYSECLAELLKK